MQDTRIREKLDKIEISYEENHRKVRCFCGRISNNSIVPHLKGEHPKEWKEWSLDFVRLRNSGLSYYSIIKEFKTKDNRLLFTSSVVEKEIQKLVEEDKSRLRKEIKMENICAFWTPGPMEIVVICIVAVLLFGRKLPKIARGIGQSLVEFKKGMKEYRKIEREIKNE